MNIDLIKEEINLLNEFYDYLRLYPKDCILDTIQEFCFDKNIPVEEIGYLIAQDSGLKQFTENNLKIFKYSKVESKSVDVW